MSKKSQITGIYIWFKFIMVRIPCVRINMNTVNFLFDITLGHYYLIKLVGLETKFRYNREYKGSLKCLAVIHNFMH